MFWFGRKDKQRLLKLDNQRLLALEDEALCMRERLTCYHQMLVKAIEAQARLNTIFAENMKNCTMKIETPKRVPMVDAESGKLTGTSEIPKSTGRITLTSRKKKSLSRRILECLDRHGGSLPALELKSTLLGNAEVTRGGGHFSRTLTRLVDEDLIDSFDDDITKDEWICVTDEGLHALTLPWKNLKAYRTLAND